VSAPEGLSFTVPAGFSHEVKTRGAARVHILKGASAVITVAGLVNENEKGCEAGHPGVAPFTTAQGLEGCAGEQHAPSGSGGFAVLRAGKAIVMVMAFVSGENALQLARAVADTVRVSPALAAGKVKDVVVVRRPDERFVGCFSSGSGSSVSVICLRDDFTFRWRSMLHVQSETHGVWAGDTRASASGEDEDQGTWWAAPAQGKGRWNLHLMYQNGREAAWFVRFYNGDLVRGEDDLWERTGG
jgi:hypothetical protein